MCIIQLCLQLEVFYLFGDNYEISNIYIFFQIFMFTNVSS